MAGRRKKLNPFFLAVPFFFLSFLLGPLFSVHPLSLTTLFLGTVIRGWRGCQGGRADGKQPGRWGDQTGPAYRRALVS